MSERTESQKPRIIQGDAKNRELKVPDGTRPMTERVKKSIFDMLGSYIIDTRCLDLFAGSGNLGIEALSRGAKDCVFVDISKKSIDIIKDNLKKVGYLDRAKTYALSYVKYILRFKDERFDLVFADPPFKLSEALNLKLLSEITTDQGIIVLKVENGSKLSIPANFEILVEKVFGINKIYIFRCSH